MSNKHASLTRKTGSVTFRRTLLFAAVVQAILPGLTACKGAASDRVAKTQTSAGYPKSPFRVDREVHAPLASPVPISVDNLPSLGSDPEEPAGGTPHELRTAQQKARADATRQNIERQDGTTTLASTASTAGAMLQNSHTGEAAVSMAKGLATGRANQAVQDWLSLLGNARVQLNVDNDFSLRNSHFDLLHPWSETPNDMFFSQSSLHRTDDRNQANMGFGWRHWAKGGQPRGIFHGDYMTGLNTFLDYDLSRDHARMGIGAEFWRDYLKMSANLYHRLTNWKTSPDLVDYEERPADGWDLGIESWLPSYPQLGAKLGYEQYYGNKVALFDTDHLQKDPRSLSADLTWTPVPLVTFSAGRRQGQNSHYETELGLNFTLSPDLTWQQQIDPSAVAAMRTLAGNRHDFVERNNNIVLEYRKKTVIAISLPDRVEGVSGMTYPLNVTVSKAKYGLAGIVWDDAAFLAAGGQLACAGTDCTVTMPLFQPGASNVYTVGATARDAKGNTSERVQTSLLVSGVGVNVGNSTFTTAQNALLADGQARTAITAVIKDNDNQPIAGLADRLTLSGTLTPDSGLVTRVVRSLRNAASGAFEPVLSSLVEDHDSPGTYTGTITAGTTAGKYALSLNLDRAELLASHLTFTDTMADVGQSTLTADKTQVTASDGSDPANQVTLTATLKDKDGNPVTGEASRLAITAMAGDTSRMTFSALKEDSGKPGTYTGTFSSTQASDSLPVILKVNGKDSGKTLTLKVAADVGSAVPDLQATSNNIEADGKTAAGLHLRVSDRFGNALAAQSVTLSVADATVSLKDTALTTDTSGAAETSLTSTTPGEKTVTATLGVKTATAKVFFVASSTPRVDSVSVDALEKPVGDGAENQFTLTAVVKDGGGNLVQGVEVNWSQSGGEGFALSEPMTTTDVNGEAHVTLSAPAHKPLKALVVSAVTDFAASKSVTVNFTADAATAHVTGVTVSKSTGTPDTDFPADGTTKVSYEAKVSDQYGNAVPGVKVDWTASVNTVTLSAKETTTVDDSDPAKNGTASITATSAVPAQGVVVGASALTGGQVDATAVNFVPGVSAAFTFTPVTSGDVLVSDGTDPQGRMVVLVKLTDATSNHPLAGETVTVDLGQSPDLNADVTRFITDVNGEGKITLTSEKAGSHDLWVKATPTGGTGGTTEFKSSYTVKFKPGAVDKAQTKVVIPKAATNEGEALDVQVFARDRFGNAIPAGDLAGRLTVTPTVESTGGLTMTTTDSVAETGEAYINVSVYPKNAITVDDRRNAVTVSAADTVLTEAPVPLAWVPDLYKCGKETGDYVNLTCTLQYPDDGNGYADGIEFVGGGRVKLFTHKSVYFVAPTFDVVNKAIAGPGTTPLIVDTITRVSPGAQLKVAVVPSSAQNGAPDFFSSSDKSYIADLSTLDSTDTTYRDVFSKNVVGDKDFVRGKYNALPDGAILLMNKFSARPDLVLDSMAVKGWDCSTRGMLTSSVSPDCVQDSGSPINNFAGYMYAEISTDVQIPETKVIAYCDKHDCKISYVSVGRFYAGDFLSGAAEPHEGSSGSDPFGGATIFSAEKSSYGLTDSMSADDVFSTVNTHKFVGSWTKICEDSPSQVVPGSGVKQYMCPNGAIGLDLINVAK